MRHSSMIPGTALAEFRRGWLALLVATIGTALGLIGMSAYCLPFFMAPLLADYGWSAAEVGAAASFTPIGILFVAPWAGRLCDRVGERRVILVSIVLFASVLLALSEIRPPRATLYIGYAIMGVLGAGTTFGCYSRLVIRFFDRARGLALGIMMCGTGLMAICAPQVLPRIIDAYGWRAGWIAMGLAALCALPLVLLVPTDRSSGVLRSTPVEGLTLFEAVRKREFITLAVGVYFVSAGQSGIQLHLLPMLTQAGLPKAMTHQAVSLYGVGIIAGRLFCGVMLDRIHGAFVAVAMFIGCAAALFAVAIHGVGLAPVLIIALGLTAGAEGDLLGFLASRYFGKKSYSELFGWLFGALALGVSSGPLIVGLQLHWFGSYRVPLLVAGTLCLIGAGLYSTLGRYRYGLVPSSETGH